MITPTDNRLWICVVYKNPVDYPGKYVIRRQSGEPDGTIIAENQCIVSDSLEEVREIMHGYFPGLVLITRHPDDDPCIVETWL